MPPRRRKPPRSISDYSNVDKTLQKMRQDVLFAAIKRMLEERAGIRKQSTRYTAGLRTPQPLTARPALRKDGLGIKASPGNHMLLPYEISSSSIPNEEWLKAKQKLDLALQHGYAPRTWKNYANGAKRFIKFAESLGIPSDKCFPADPQMVCLFIAQGLGRTSSSLAQSNLSAIGAWHRINGMEFQAPPQTKVIKKALDAHWPLEKQKKPPRSPIVPQMMLELFNAWNGGSSRQRCALALAMAAWSGQMRLGELMPESQKIIDASRLPRRSNWQPSDDMPGSSQINLPWSKTKLFKGDTVYLMKQKAPLDATLAITNHFATSILSDSAFLCSFKEGNKISIMDKKSFMFLCNRVWSRMGRPSITGHSFRIGGTTALLCAKVDPAIVKKMGRWSSDAFMRYWRNNLDIFKNHVTEIDFGLTI
ncbi:hypothetical protein FRC16_007857 [Serendipita sp. 398]|nr:hypothetical protein FRC16_007857 [Serendipita sp. 398]